MVVKNQKTHYRLEKNETKEIVLESPGEYLIELLGSGANVTIKGSFLAQKSQKKEICVVIHHKSSHTQAQTVLKGVGEDFSHLKIIGKIVIDKNCNNVQSFLTERVLLLDEAARAEAIPDLEIKSDDVKCSHATSITFIPEEQIFYLMSRGIARKEAEEMLVEGFLGLKQKYKKPHPKEFKS